jgi:putative hydrolase of the HAD superfamily
MASMSASRSVSLRRSLTALQVQRGHPELQPSHVTVSGRVATPPTIENVADKPDYSAPDEPRLRGVITDWGGVLTNSIAATVNAWLEAERIDRDRYLAVMLPWLVQAYDPDGPDCPVHLLERGECDDAEFERLLADQLVTLDGTVVEADGLLARMFAATVLDTVMLDLIRALRRAGLRTALLSNSWGGSDYPRHLFPELFDVVVISAEVGMRKPERRIFTHTAALLGLEPAECVFIDDIEANVTAAEAVGLVGLLHQEPGPTADRLAELLGVPLA